MSLANFEPTKTTIKMKLFVTLLILASQFALGQVGINTTTPHPSAMLDLNSTVSGLLIPRMTQAQKTAIPTPATGLLIYQTDATTGFWYYNGTAWVTFSSTGWNILGDVGTNPTTNFLGTIDNQDFVIATNNNERVRIQTDGDIGVNQPNPTTKIHITGTNPSFRLVDGSQAANKVLTSDANGKATWSNNNTITGAPDDDWRFNSGSSYASPIHHIGPVVIGRTGTTTHHIDVDNGANTGTTMGIGNNEYLQDGNNETQFSHNFVPLTDDYLDLGSSTKRWRTIYATNGTIQTSDANDKTNIQKIKYGVEDLAKLKTISFKWKNEHYLQEEIPSNKRETKIGLIAQDLEKVIPEVVYNHTWRPKSEKENKEFVKVENKYLGVNYEELVAVLVKAKQEQQLEIEQLEKETAELLQKVKLLKSN